MVSAETKEKKSSTNLPWVEKYRPTKLEDLVSHRDVIKTLSKFIDENRLPHLLFYGPPGTGKTTTILAAARQIYPPEEIGPMVLELNASDDRGINVVRQQILTFAQTKAMYSKTKYKLVILDESDAMTKDAQNALRRVIEKYTSSVRFCLICNYLSKIIPAIQSRCTRFRFPPLSRSLMLPRLRYVVEQEQIKVTEDGEKALVTLAQGDMRRVLNVLQSTSMAFEEVTEVSVYTCVGHPLKKDIRSIVEFLLNSTFTEAFQNVNGLKQSKGLALSDIVTEAHSFVQRLDVPVHVKVFIIDELSTVERRLCGGANEKLQLSALISTFQIAREMIDLVQQKYGSSSK